MASTLEISSIKQKSLDFVNLLGNEHDTTSDKIVGLLATEFAVQHAELPPSEGGRDAFLTNLGQRLKLAKGHVSVDVKHVVAEVVEDDEAKGGQCWVYSTKNTPFGSTNSLDMIAFNYEGKIIHCQDLHGPRHGTYSSFFKWLVELLFGIQTHGSYQASINKPSPSSSVLERLVKCCRGCRRNILLTGFAFSFMSLILYCHGLD